MKLNGQTINWTREESHSLCQCGHIKLGHVHYNGDLGIPDGTPTYCGYEDCQCGKFRDRVIQTTEGNKNQFERKFERIINLFVSVEIVYGYTLTTEFSDEFLAAVKEARDYCKERIETAEED